VKLLFIRDYCQDEYVGLLVSQFLNHDPATTSPLSCQ